MAANWKLTPVFRPAVIELCRRYDKPIICGAYTPTEALNAHEAGADFIKIFPADGLGIGYIKALRAGGATASAKVGSFVNRADAALPEDIRQKITKRRRAGDIDAALDPLADPEVKAAIARTRFEMLVGFQLTEEQLVYNVRR